MPAPGDGVRVAPPSESTHMDPYQDEPTVLVLVGLIASGKSTFANALEGHFPRFRRCNQDELGSRQRVEELAYHTLREGRSPCIDRTNFNVVQRSHWSAIARVFPGTSISIIVFDTLYDVRTGFEKEQVTDSLGLLFAGLCFPPRTADAQHGVAILQKFASEFEEPSPDEGYDHIIYIQPEDYPRPEYTRDDVLSILERLKASTRDSGTSITSFGRSSGAYSRTDQTRGYRGRGCHRAFSPARGTLYGSPRFAHRAQGSNMNANWRLPSPGVAANRVRSNQGSAVAANVPPMESSKGSDSAEGRHNSS